MDYARTAKRSSTLKIVTMTNNHTHIGFAWIVLPALLLTAACSAQEEVFDQEVVDRLAGLALECVHKEYPNKISHVLQSDNDVAAPRELTPVFFGCFDWHSSVHGHWMLARLAHLYPDAPFAAEAMTALGKSFEAKRILSEVGYFEAKGRTSFERPYGIAWFLQLMSELREWDEPVVADWADRLAPLETVLAHRISEWLPKLSHPIRGGEHFQTAFAFGLIHDWAVTTSNEAMQQLIFKKSMEFYGQDIKCPLDYEPSGHDFLSSCWAEADLMRRLMAQEKFSQWLGEFLPGIPQDEKTRWFEPVTVTDPSDPKLSHLDGLNLSRSWMLDGVASALANNDPRKKWLKIAAQKHRTAGLAQVTGEYYEGGHWLASFATYTVTGRGVTRDQ